MSRRIRLETSLASLLAQALAGALAPVLHASMLWSVLAVALPQSLLGLRAGEGDQVDPPPHLLLRGGRPGEGLAS